MYFMSKGWLQGERNIWVEYLRAREKYGEDTAREIMAMMFGSYQKLGILDTGLQLHIAVLTISIWILKITPSARNSRERIYASPNNLDIEATTKHTSKPIVVGTAKETAVHLRLCVSFFIVKQVVEHGQCSKENSIVQTAVSQVQPLLMSNSLSAEMLSVSMLPLDKYAMMMIGTTISLAGKPSMNANKITPSSPNARAKGSRNCVHMRSRLISAMVTLAIIQISSPVGAAMAAARESTNSVRSSIERKMTLPICGLR